MYLWKPGAGEFLETKRVQFKISSYKQFQYNLDSASVLTMRELIDNSTTFYLKKKWNSSLFQFRTTASYPCGKTNKF